MHASLAVLLSWVWLMLPDSPAMESLLSLKLQSRHLKCS